MASDIPSPDKVLANPTQIAIFSDEDIIELQKSGKIVAVARSALASSAAGNEVFSQKDDKGALLPVFVVPREGMDAGSQAAARIIMLTNNRKAVFINEGYHEWNEHYVRKHIMYSKHEVETFLSPQDMLGIVKSFEPNKAVFVEAIEKPALQLVGAIGEAAKKSGIDNLKIVVSDKAQHAAVFTIQEGDHYLVINPSVLLVNSLTADKREDFLGVVGHEFAHIKNGDTLPQKLIAGRNQEVKRAMETLADLTAPPIEGVSSMAKYLKSILTGYIPQYNKENPDKPVAAESNALPEMKVVSDWLYKTTPNHPHTLQRIAGMEIQEALMHGLESSALRRGHLLSDKEKQDNANWALGKVLQQIKDGTLPDPASMKPHASVPEHVKQQVKETIKLPMQEAEAVHKPATPVSVPEPVEVQKR